MPKPSYSMSTRALKKYLRKNKGLPPVFIRVPETEEPFGPFPSRRKAGKFLYRQPEQTTLNGHCHAAARHELLELLGGKKAEMVRLTIKQFIGICLTTGEIPF